MIRRYSHRPDDAALVMVLRHVDDSLERTGNTDAVAAHPDQLILLILILVDRVHRRRIFRAELEDLSDLHTSGMAYRRAADRAGIALLERL